MGRGENGMGKVWIEEERGKGGGEERRGVLPAHF